MPDELELLIQQIKNDVGEEKYNIIYKSRFEKLRKQNDAIKILKKKYFKLKLWNNATESWDEYGFVTKRRVNVDVSMPENEKLLTDEEHALFKEVLCK